MIETKKQREKRERAEAPLRAKRAADYARAMNTTLVDSTNVTVASIGTTRVCPHCGGTGIAEEGD